MRLHPLAVCSWSLEPNGIEELLERLRATGVSRVQLALDPIRTGRFPRHLAATFGPERIEIASGMMAMAGEDYSTPDTIRRTGGLVPDETWAENRAAARDDARLARYLGIELVTFHAGFIPERHDDPSRAQLIARLRELARVYADAGVGVGLETGQEPASALRQLLDDVGEPSVGVNFDPANLVLYGTGDPIAAFRDLADRVVQVHLKDALPPRHQGEWGTEVPLGTGVVDWAAFFAVLRAVPRPVTLVIEREAGTNRVEDVARGVDFLRRIGAPIA